MSFGGMASDDIQSVETSIFATFVLAKLKNMKIHDLWAAASMLYPGLRAFPFLIYSKERSEFMDCAKGLIFCLYDSVGDRASNKIPTSSNARHPASGLTALGKGYIYSDKLMSIVHIPNRNKLKRYPMNDLSLAITLYLKKDPMSVIEYCIDHQGRYPIPSKVALRIVATPAFSAGSKRDFSVVNKLFSEDLSYLGDGIIADMTFLKPVITNFTFENFNKLQISTEGLP